MRNSWLTKIDWKDLDLSKFFFFCLLLLAALHILRASGHYSPIYGGDEYSYFASGIFRSHLPLLWERDPLMQKITNPLFLVYIKAASVFFNDASVIVRIGIAMSYVTLLALASLYVWRSAGSTAAGGCILALGLLPSSCYSAGVMADVPYYCGVVAAVLGAAALFTRRPYLASATAGWLLALAFLLKPHTLAPIVASLTLFGILAAFGLTSKSSEVTKKSCIGAVVFGASLYATLVLFSLVFMERVYWNPRYPLGPLYTSISYGVSTNGITEALRNPVLFFRYLLANGLCVLMVCAPFCYVVALNTYALYRRGGPYSPAEQRHLLLSLWLLLAIPATLLMVSLFTFTVGQYSTMEAFRLHARYYAFLYVLIIVAALAIPNWSKLISSRIRLFGTTRLNGHVGFAAFWLFVIVVGYLHNRGFRLWFQDNPELFSHFAVFAKDWSLAPDASILAKFGFALLVASPLIALLFRRNLTLVTCALMFVSSAIALTEVTKIQHIHSRAIHFRVETGQLIRAFLPALQGDELLFVGESRYGETAHVMYGTICLCHVMQSKPEVPVTREMLPASVRYVFTVDDVPLSFETEKMFSTPAGTLHKIR